jgi:hypothetical protein
MIEITIMRGADIILSVKPTNTSSQSKKIMGDNVVALTFELNKIINFRIGDTAEIFGEIYRLNRMPVVEKGSLYDYSYTMVMQSLQYDLANAQYMFYDSNNVLQEGDFSLTGTAQTFIDLIVTNINRISSGWTRGAVTGTAYKTLTFSKEDCLSVLGRLATEFGSEYYVDGKKINLAKQVSQTPYKFRYGRGKGLYKIARSQPDNQKIITRLYAFGAEKNLPGDYPSSRLRLPGGYDCLIHNLSWTITLVFFPFYNVYFTWDAPTNISITAIRIDRRLIGSTTWQSVTTPGTSYGLPGVPIIPLEFRFASLNAAGNQIAITPVIIVIPNVASVTPLFTGVALPYLEDFTAQFGIREGDYITDDIYPHRTGVISSVDVLDIYSFIDSDIDFNVNDYLLPGVVAKLTFVTGQLSGYAFDISAFDNSIKKFTILKNKDEKTLDIPNVDLKPVIGDSYVLTDIAMPASYVQAAEQLLQSKAQEYLDLNSSPAYQYSITCDPAYFRRRNIKMDIGNIVWLQDTELDIDKYIRVVSVTKSLLDEFEYTLELGEVVAPGIVASLTITGNSNSSAITNTQRALDQNKLLNGINIGDLKIEQGTLIISDIQTNSGTPLKIDANGRICI